MSSFALNPGGMYPQMAAAVPPPTGPYTDDQQKTRRMALVRKPTGDMQAAEGEGHDVPQPGQVVESLKQTPDTDSAQGTPPTGAQPASQTPPSPQTPVNPDPLAAVTAQTQTNKPYQSPSDRAGYYSGKLSAMGPEPTWNTLPDEQKHHGGRKVLDYLGAIAAGLVSGSPLAGEGTYEALSQRPLRRAQEDYQAQAAPLAEGFKRESEMAKQSTAEERVQGMEAMYQGRLSTAEGLKEKYGKTITNKWQDANGDWKGQQADGTVVDTSPPTGQGRDDAGDKINKENVAREHEADRLGLTGKDRKDYILYGAKSPETKVVMPKQPSAESEEYGDWQKQFTIDNKRPPNAQEIQNYHHPERQAPGHAKDRETFDLHWQKQFDAGERAKAAARQQILKGYGADKDAGAYKDNKDEIEPKLAEIEAGWEQKKGQLQAEKDAEAEQYGVYNKQPGSSQAPPGGQPQAAAPKPAQQGGQLKTSKGTFTMNQKVMVDGKPKYVTGVGKSGKPIVSDQPGQ